MRVLPNPSVGVIQQDPKTELKTSGKGEYKKRGWGKKRKYIQKTESKKNTHKGKMQKRGSCRIEVCVSFNKALKPS